MPNFIGAAKIEAMGDGPRYRVYQDLPPCRHCREGATWGVLDTVEDILIGGISYHREEDAEWLADQLNDAVAAERTRIREELWQRFDDLTVYVEWNGAESRAVKAPYAERADLNEALNEICPAHDTTSDSTTSSK